METTAIVKQMLGFQRTIFANSFSAMVTAQDPMEKMVTNYLDQLPWVPAEAKKNLLDSVEMGKKARDDFKKAVDDGYAKFEEIMEAK